MHDLAENEFSHTNFAAQLHSPTDQNVIGELERFFRLQRPLSIFSSSLILSKNESWISHLA
jgi:hypothetical protein